jgi:UDP-2-acetamido-2-deoxy-ribo-hexuluronate aminotransferase
VYAQYTIQVENRPQVEAGLKQRGIPTAVHYPVPLHFQPVFAGLDIQAGAFPHSEAASDRVMSLPMHPYLTEEQQLAVVKALKETVLG